MSISLEVEAIAGGSMEESAQKMVDLAKQLDIMITCKWNGHLIIAMNNMEPKDLLLQYEAWIESSKLLKSKR